MLGAVSGPLKHQVRVAGNLSRILEREQQLGPELDRRERELLAGLLSEAGERASADQSAESLAAKLSDLLLSGDPELEKRAFAPLVEIVRGKLQIAKPGHDGYGFEGEQGE